MQISAGALFIFWILLVIVITLLLWNYGSNISSALALALIISTIILCVFSSYNFDGSDYGTTWIVALTVIISVIYVLLYIIYINSIEISSCHRLKC